VLGSSILLVGLAMVVLPGPAILVVPLGLSILGIEFAWARRWLVRMRATLAGANGRIGAQLTRQKKE
ncbi:MAG: PGPGW domain-containing protein, partial [Gammaproteobacteria bacterium]|nr:PGPGW domain-containing protein [Gammaproteobacteria bacterium]